MPGAGHPKNRSATRDLLMEVWRMLLALIRQEVHRTGPLGISAKVRGWSSMAGMKQMGSFRGTHPCRHLSQWWCLDLRGKQSIWALGDLCWQRLSNPKLKIWRLLSTVMSYTENSILRNYVDKIVKLLKYTWNKLIAWWNLGSVLKKSSMYELEIWTI